MQIHSPGTASSYTCSADSVGLNFLQMIKEVIQILLIFPSTFSTLILSITVTFTIEKKFKFISFNIFT
jgi:hypothetical protein